MVPIILLIIILCIQCQLSVQQKNALLIIDVQNCFLPGGSLEVNDGNDVIPVINKIRDKFDVIVLTQDWHCKEHISFASQHPGYQIYEEIQLEYDRNGMLCKNGTCQEGNAEHKLNQTLWPDHCVMHSEGAKLSTLLTREETDLVIRKGSDCDIDSYSAFYDNGGFTKTVLNDRLQELGVSSVYISGLALDFCVFYSAMDAHHLGYETFVIQDASRGITPDGVAEAMQQMKEKGISIIQSAQLFQDNNGGEWRKLPHKFLLLSAFLAILPRY